MIKEDGSVERQSLPRERLCEVPPGQLPSSLDEYYATEDLTIPASTSPPNHNQVLEIDPEDRLFDDSPPFSPQRPLGDLLLRLEDLNVQALPRMESTNPIPSSEGNRSSSGSDGWPRDTDRSSLFGNVICTREITTDENLNTEAFRSSGLAGEGDVSPELLGLQRLIDIYAAESDPNEGEARILSNVEGHLRRQRRAITGSMPWDNVLAEQFRVINVQLRDIARRRGAAGNNSGLPISGGAQRRRREAVSMVPESYERARPHELAVRFSAPQDHSPYTSSYAEVRHLPPVSPYAPQDVDALSRHGSFTQAYAERRGLESLDDSMSSATTAATAARPGWSDTVPNDSTDSATAVSASNDGRVDPARESTIGSDIPSRLRERLAQHRRRIVETSTQTAAQNDSRRLQPRAAPQRQPVQPSAPNAMYHDDPSGSSHASTNPFYSRYSDPSLTYLESLDQEEYVYLAMLENQRRRRRAAPRRPTTPEEDRPSPLDSNPDKPPPLTEEQMMKEMKCKICLEQIADVALFPCGMYSINSLPLLDPEMQKTASTRHLRAQSSKLTPSRPLRNVPLVRARARPLVP